MPIKDTRTEEEYKIDEIIKTLRSWTNYQTYPYFGDPSFNINELDSYWLWRSLKRNNIFINNLRNFVRKLLEENKELKDINNYINYIWVSSSANVYFSKERPNQFDEDYLINDFKDPYKLFLINLLNPKLKEAFKTNISFISEEKLKNLIFDINDFFNPDAKPLNDEKK